MLAIEFDLAYDEGMATPDQRDGAAEAEAVRVRRLGKTRDGTISVNLARGKSQLSHS